MALATVGTPGVAVHHGKGGALPLLPLLPSLPASTIHHRLLDHRTWLDLASRLWSPFAVQEALRGTREDKGQVESLFSRRNEAQRSKQLIKSPFTAVTQSVIERAFSLSCRGLFQNCR